MTRSEFVSGMGRLRGAMTPLMLLALVQFQLACTTSEASKTMSDAATAATGAAKSMSNTITAAVGGLIVELDANDPSAGTAKWINKGSMGDFTAIGKPTKEMIGNVAAVKFDGKADAYRSDRTTTSDIEGAHPRTIEVWAYNPSLDSVEECMVAWGQRGADFSNLSFNYGANSDYSAVTHYGTGNDMSWGDDPPAAGQWHYLAYTYDGKTAKIYADGAQRGSQDLALTTSAGQHVNIAAENAATTGAPQFESEFGDPAWQMSLSGDIAIVRVRGASLSADQIKAAFKADAARFGVAAN